MNNQMRRACPICAGRDFDVLHHQKFVAMDGHPAGAGHDVVCCAACGFVFADVCATQAEYDEFYTRHSKYDDVQTGTGGGATTWDAARLRQTARDIAAFLRDDLSADDSQRDGARILDIGCATGGLLRELKELGFANVYGIDPSPNCAAWARRENGVAAHAGSLQSIPDAPAFAEPFDCVLLSHVLEHVLDVSGALRVVDSLVREGGAIYLEVPDATRYADHIAAPFQDFNTEHINHFGPQSLFNLTRARSWQRFSWNRKVLQTGGIATYPAQCGFWRKAAGRNNAKLEKDEELRPSIEAYIARSRVLLDEIDTRLRDALSRHDAVVVWGAGQLTLKLLAETCLSQARIKYFVDANPIHHGQTLRGLPIVAPSHLKGDDAPVVIASTIHQAAILGAMREQNLTNETILLKG